MVLRYGKLYWGDKNTCNGEDCIIPHIGTIISPLHFIGGYTPLKNSFQPQSAPSKVDYVFAGWSNHAVEVLASCYVVFRAPLVFCCFVCRVLLRAGPAKPLLERFDGHAAALSVTRLVVKI